jgi:hypothetical protein
MQAMLTGPRIAIDSDFPAKKLLNGV